MSDSGSESERDRYTIDEMMERLHGRDKPENPEGELVTRADGSQARKVRRRRRRSNQPEDRETKRNQRVQMLQIAGFVVVLVMTGLAVGVGILYANSTSFRESLVSKAESSSGAKVVFRQFRMNPATANAAEVTMGWPAGNPLDTILLRSISAKIAPSSFLGSTFRGEEIVALQGEMVLKAPVSDGPVRHTELTEEKIPFQFNRYSVPSLDISFGAENKTANLLKGSEVSLFPSSVSGHAEIRVTGGLLTREQWPAMELDRSYIKVKNSTLEVKSMRFIIPVPQNQRISDRGYVDFSGTIQPLETNHPHLLTAKLESFRLSYLLGADLGRFFLGKVETLEDPDSNFLSFSPGSGKPEALVLTLGNALDSRIDLSGFSFLSNLALVLRERWYELPNFEDGITMHLKREGNSVVISGINLVDRGRMAIRGGISNGAGGAISGKLELGLPDSIIISSKNKRIDRMFGPEREGYRWIDLEISGTSAVPLDNFRSLYDSATTEGSNEPEVGPRPQDTFEGLMENK